MKYFGSFRNEKFPSLKRLTYRISSFSGIDARPDIVPKNLSIGSYGYNIHLGRGKLTDSYGVCIAAGKNGESLPTLQSEGEKILRVHRHFDKTDGDKLLVHSDVGRFYSCSLSEPEESFKYYSAIEDASEDLSFINYYTDGTDYTLIFSPIGFYRFSSAGLEDMGESIGVIGACMHFDRIFGVLPDENAVAFSKLLDPFTFDPASGGGKIYLMGGGGRLLKAVSLGSAVYIFREYSIYKLSALADPQDFSLKEVLTLSYPVRPRTIASDGADIYFVAGEEIYRMNASSVDKPFENVTPLIESAEKAVGRYMMDKYFLSCKMRKFGTETVGLEGTAGLITHNNALFAFGKDELDIVRGIGIDDFSTIPGADSEGVLLALSGNYGIFAGSLTDDGKFYGVPSEKFWSSHSLKPGDAEAVKKIRSLHIASTYPLTVGAESETGKDEFNVYGGYAVGYAPLKTPPGGEIRLYLKTSDKLCVSEAVVVFDEFAKYVP